MDVRRSVADPLFDARVNILGTINLLEGARKANVTSRAVRVVRRRRLRRAGAVPGAGDASDEPAESLRREQARGRALRLLLPGGVPPAVRRAPLRQRLRAAAGPARRGRRGRHLQRPDAPRASRSRSTATASRRATTSSSATWRGRTCWRWRRQATGPFNIGTGVETDVNQLAQGLLVASGSRSEMRHGAAKPGEQRRSVVDCARGRRCPRLASRGLAGRGPEAHGRLVPVAGGVTGRPWGGPGPAAAAPNTRPTRAAASRNVPP